MGRSLFVRLFSGALVVSLGAWPAAAQDADGQFEAEGRGYVTVGTATVDLESLNARLDAYGYPALPETVLTIGGGGHGVHRRWTIGGEGAALIGRGKDAQGGLETKLNGGYGFFNLGYLIVKQDTLHVYPLLGVGGGGTQLEFNDTVERTFDELLANPRGNTRATTGGFLMQVALGLDNLFVLGTRETEGGVEEGGLVLGVRVGYVFGPGQSNWRSGGTDLAGGPDLSLKGPYIRVTVGGGGRRLAR